VERLRRATGGAALKGREPVPSPDNKKLDNMLLDCGNPTALFKVFKGLCSPCSTYSCVTLDQARRQYAEYRAHVRSITAVQQKVAE